MEGNEFSLTIGNLLETAADNSPNQIISYKGKENYTYRKFYERVNSLARALVELGVRKGDRKQILLRFLAQACLYYC